MSGGGEGTSLEFTPTWVVAAVCSVIVAISLALERLLHFLGTYLKKKNQKPLNEALQKVKEELMLLGFISLLLTVFQGTISKWCVPESLTEHLLPCDLKDKPKAEEDEHGSSTTEHFQTFFVSSISGTARRLLSEGSASQNGYCASKDKVPLLSLEALHHLHIFIFILAIVHVTFCVLTVVFGGLKIRQWKAWEDSIAKENYDAEDVLEPKVTHVHQHAFIKDHFQGIGKDSALLGWLRSFLKQFYASVTKADYVTLRLGFIMTHCRGNPKFNFHKYMIRALEDDFKHVVGISWYLWIFVVVFLLLNINGWHTYFWIAFIPLILLLAVGAKLEHVIAQLAHEVAEKHVAIEGDLIVQPSDDHFWFQRPRIVLFLIHFILFQNAFEIGFFFWIWVQYGFDSCIMGKVAYIIPRLIIGVFVQVLCSYSTLPLYAIVTQMGSSFKKAIFEDHVQVGLVGWAQKVKKRKGLKAAATDGSSQGSKEDGSSVGIQLGNVLRKASTAPTEIKPDASKSNDLP
ncbi:MLO-like protein 1 [Cucurbita argyrosperma subsp. argyrosperma]|uniref:MLO-like protein n=1 Tax=Cucurbita moschata TaxID=3662 RepID=A0A6J1HJG6_CUCMO|nr:MLO-like protein 1 [Cucurbita moschata]KAG7026081.1 MLO-like protein 1 [Cucurbita argyrosperma subsp. argyrosperma]